MASQIEGAVSDITPPEVPIEADTSGIDAALDETSSKAANLGGAGREAGLGLGTIAPAAALATGELGRTSDILGGISPEMLGVAGATTGLVLAGKQLFASALEQNTALARLREQFGPLADEVEHVHIGGLNEDLEHLAVRTGADVDGLRNFAASFAQLGKSAGDSTPHIADVAQQIQALAVRASVLNPNLGTADQIVQRLSTSLARGGRFLSLYGISLSTAQINAEALRETGKRATSDLSIYDKVVAGATLATQGLGNSLGKDINDGAQKAAVQLRALKAQFEETLKSAGRPLIQPTIDAFRDLEPVLASAANLLGIGLSGALHVVGPLLSVLATILSNIPAPVAAGVLAFAGLQRVLNGLTFEGLIAFLTTLPAKAAGAVASLLGIGAAAETAAAETEASAVEAGAATAALDAINPIALGLAVVIGGLTLAWEHHKQAVAEQKREVDELSKSFQDNSKTIEESIATLAQAQLKTHDQTDEVAKLGITTQSLGQLAAQGKAGYGEFLDTLVRGGAIHAETAAQLLRSGVSVKEFVADAGAGAASAKDLGSAGLDLVKTFQQLQETARQAAHETLSSAVANGELSRADEVAAIRNNTLKNGHVDWIGVLQQINPQLRQAAQSTQLYGDAQSKATEQTDPLVAAQDRMTHSLAQAGNALERQLVQSGQFTQSQIDTANAINTNKDGTIDYGKALDALRPGLGGVAADSGQLAGGLDTTATKFQLASDEAKVFQTQLDELLNPILNAKDAEVAWHQEIDTLTASLAKNGNTIDLNTKAGQDNVLGIDNLVKKGTDYIDKLIAEGAATDVVTAKKAEVIAKLREEEQHYPALTPLIEGYIGQINAIPVSHLTDTGLPNAAGSVASASAVSSSIDGIPTSHSTDVNVSVHRGALDGLIGDLEQLGRTVWHTLVDVFTGQGRMAGGPVWPGVWTVGEAGPETLVLGNQGSGFVIPNSGTSEAPSSAGGISAADLNTLGRMIARALAAQRPITVISRSDDPVVTATAVSTRVGADAMR